MAATQWAAKAASKAVLDKDADTMGQVMAVVGSGRLAISWRWSKQADKFCKVGAMTERIRRAIWISVAVLSFGTIGALLAVMLFYALSSGPLTL